MGRNRRRKREVSSAVLPSLTVPRLLPATRLLSPLSDFRTFQSDMLGDRRQYHPLHDHRPATFSTGGTARTVLKDRSYGRKSPALGFSQTKAIQAFGSPHAVGVCVRRKTRREVLFANRRAGRGGSQRRHRKNWHSAIKC